MEKFITAKAPEIQRITEQVELLINERTLTSGFGINYLDNIINYVEQPYDIYQGGGLNPNSFTAMTSYIPEIPLGLFGVIGAGIGIEKAKNNLQAGGEEAKGIAPRIGYYQKGLADIFTIRGTHNKEDLATDALLSFYLKPDLTGQIAGSIIGTGMSGGVSGAVGAVVGAKVGGMVGARLFNLDGSILNRKLELYEEFIRTNYRGGKIVVAGHSLGSLEMNLLLDKLSDLTIESVGFGHPALPPSKKASVVYSIEGDPLYSPNNSPNHKVLKKQYQKTGGSRFDQFHSTSNYYKKN